MRVPSRNEVERIRRQYPAGTRICCDSKYSLTVQLPKEPLELYDILDRLGVDNRYCNVYINIEDECIPMTVNIRHRGRRWSEDFPKNSYELLDFADKLRNDYPFSVKIEKMFELLK